MGCMRAWAGAHARTGLTPRAAPQFLVYVPLNTRSAVMWSLEPFIDRQLVTVVLANFTQNLNRSVSPGEGSDLA